MNDKQIAEETAKKYFPRTEPIEIDTLKMAIEEGIFEALKIQREKIYEKLDKLNENWDMLTIEQIKEELSKEVDKDD